MAAGDMSVKQSKPVIQGPQGKGPDPKMADCSKGPKGMRQTYKQTGTPGKGHK